MDRCKVTGCNELVMPLPDKSRKSYKVKEPYQVCFHTKPDPDALCFFHKNFPKETVKRQRTYQPFWLGPKGKVIAKTK